MATEISSTNNEKNHDNVVDSEENVKQGFFDGFSVKQMIFSAAVGAVLGIGYSVFDQTILHKQHPSYLPYKSEILAQKMPDVVEKMEKFYKYRQYVSLDWEKQEFKRMAKEMLKQCEYFAIVFDKMLQIHNKNDSGGITPEGQSQHFTLRAQAKKHFDIIVQYLRSMAILIKVENNLVVENDFNELYSLFLSRFYIIHQKVLGSV